MFRSQQKALADRARSLSASSIERLEKRVVLAQLLGPLVELDIPIPSAVPSPPPAPAPVEVTAPPLPKSIQFRDRATIFEHDSKKLNQKAIDAVVRSIKTWTPQEVGKHDFNRNGSNFWRKAPSAYAPEVTGKGIIVAKRFTRNTSPHTMMTAGARGTECLHTGGSYLQQDFHYRFSFDVRHPKSETSWLNDHGWGIVMQLWGPREANESARNPPFSIYSKTIDGKPHWVVRSYGDARRTTQTGQYQEKHQEAVLMKGIGDWHTFDVEFVPNPFGDGMIRTWLDGALVAEWKDIKNIYYSKFDGHPTGPLSPGFGLYSSMDENGMEVHLDNISIDCYGRFQSSIAGVVSGTNHRDGLLVVATNQATGKSYGTHTNSSGVYTLSVPQGKYSITAAMDAKGLRAPAKEVSTAKTSQRVNLQLKPLPKPKPKPIPQPVRQEARSFSADVTGNKKSEIINQLSDGSWHVSVANGKGAYNTSVWGKWSTNVAWYDVHVADFTGDGRADIIGRDSTGRWLVSQSNGKGFEHHNWGKWSTSRAWVDVTVADFNGDGLADVAGRDRDNGEWQVSLSNSAGFVTGRWGKWSPDTNWLDLSVGDFNGDGRDDIAGRSKQDGTWWVARSDGEAFRTERWGKWSASVNWQDVLVGDFDGDGKSDLVGRNGTKWWVALSNGNLFQNRQWASWESSAIWTDIVVADVNGDGRSDLVGRLASEGTWWAARSHGDRFENYFWGTTWPTKEKWTTTHVDDFDGDGTPELLGGTSKTWLISLCCAEQEPHASASPEVEPNGEAKTELKPQTEPQTKSEPQPDGQPKPGAEPQVESEPEPERETEPQVEPTPVTEAESGPDPDPADSQQNQDILNVVDPDLDLLDRNIPL